MEINSTQYCWVIGNTGFRESALYQKIESYLLILEEFNSLGYNWSDNQKEFFGLMQKYGFMSKASTSETNIKKAARLKTSPLEKLGLVTENRIITDVGKIILDRAKLRIEKSNMAFDQDYFLENDGDIYIKQLIKLHFHPNNSQAVRPFILLLEYLEEFKYISYNEITYIVPLIISSDMKDYGKNLIRDYRNQFSTSSFDEFAWIKKHIIKHKNNIKNIAELRRYIEQNILEIKAFVEREEKNKIEEFLIKIDDNGKSKDYSLKLYDLFLGICRLWKDINDFEKSKTHIDYIIRGIDRTSSTQEKLWRRLIIGVSNKGVLKSLSSEKYKEYIEYFINNLYNTDFNSFLINFFDILWYVKIINNLEDYSDHNIRYLKLSNIFETGFENGEKYLKVNEFYKVLVSKILDDPQSNKLIINNSDYTKWLYHSTYNLPTLHEADMQQIADNVITKIESISTEKIINIKPSDLNYRQWITALKDKYIEIRIINMIEETRKSIVIKSKDNIINCLEYIKKRKDSKLKEILDTEADIPTVFEYLVWKSFLLFGDYMKNPIKFANFSFDNDLKPIQHAGGGIADVIFEYQDHDLILEATLTNEENQRKLEMEPVPRHLARYRNEVNNDTYGIFVAPNIDPNVAVVHRAFKQYPYYVKNKGSNEYKPINKLLILPISINELESIIIYSIRNDILYSEIKEKIFLNLLNSDTSDGYLWYTNEVKTAMDSLENFNDKYDYRNEYNELIAEKQENY